MLIADLIPRVHAAVVISPIGSANPGSSGDASAIVSNAATSIINLLFLLGGILAVIYLLWSGVQYISAGGNPDKVKTARQGIVNAVIGVVIMMAAFAIIRFAVALGSTASRLDKAGAVQDQGTSSGSQSTTTSSGTKSSTQSTTSSTSSTSSTTSGGTVNSSGTNSSTSSTSSSSSTTSSTNSSTSSDTQNDSGGFELDS